MIDNHIYFGNQLGFEKVVWKRCVDLNDRQLRKITCGLSEEKNIVPREDSFDITVASEIMAIFCLAKDLNDLTRRIGNIIVGYNKEGAPITAKDLKADGALSVLLKDAINPNLVQTLEGTPAIIHGGPFANIAHGCNSIIATKMSLKLADYIVTEAGFGADLGAEKFLDIKCRIAGLKPDAVVIVATMKALKYHGGLNQSKIMEEDLETLEKGIDNLLKHVDNMKNKFGLNVIIAINKYITDTDKEVAFLQDKLTEQNISLSLVEAWEKGGIGAADLANQIVDLCEKETKLNYTYELEDSIESKLEKLTGQIYGACGVEYTETAKEKIEQIKKLGYENLPICVAKTQYSLSDDPKNLLCENDFKITVKDVILKTGAGFIVIITGKIVTMPGLPKIPAAESIYIDENGNTVRNILISLKTLVINVNKKAIFRENKSKRKNFL